MQRLAFVMVLVVVVTGCSKQQHSSSQSSRPALPAVTTGQSAREASKIRTEKRLPSIPPRVKYSILDSDTIPGVKRTLSVRLNRKVSEDTLRAIALKLKSEDPNEYERTLIAYWLPGMAVGTGAWATTHFDPDLEVNILGLTADQELAQKAKPQPSNRKIVGKWTDNGVGGGTMTIYREHGEYYLETQYTDGSMGTINLTRSGSRRYNKPEPSAGDHYVINSNGDLELGDADGLIATATKAD